MKKEKKRTIQQNKALHKMFSILADELSNAGYDMRRTLKPTIDIPWTTSSVKEFIWKPIMKIQTGKSSTTELTTTEIDEVFDTINRHLGESFGFNISFPSVDSLINESRLKSTT